MNTRKDLFQKENKIAQEYDLVKLAIPHHDEFQVQVGIELKKRFDKETSINILEIGSGTGITTLEILKTFPDAKIVSVDVEDFMIKQAQEKNFPEKVQFVVADALSFLRNSKKESFDVVVSAYTLHNIEVSIRDQILAGVYQVLKPQGVFINADKIASDDLVEHKNNLDWQIKKFSDFELHGLVQLKKEWTEHYLSDNQDNLKIVESIFKKKLSVEGFQAIQTTYRKRLEAVIVAIR